VLGYEELPLVSSDYRSVLRPAAPARRSQGPAPLPAEASVRQQIGSAVRHCGRAVHTGRRRHPAEALRLVPAAPDRLRTPTIPAL
jgi:hypothetical protein